MPTFTSRDDVPMQRLPGALRRRMKALGHTQMDVFLATGVPQPQISKALNGTRKRLTDPMRELCRYAGIDVAAPPSPSLVSELTELVRELVGTNEETARALKSALTCLAPLLKDPRAR